MHQYFEDPRSGERLSSEDYMIDANGLVNVNTGVAMFNTSPNRLLPVAFGVVDGDFLVGDSNLKNLRGSPHTVNGDFDCSNNNLKSLMFAPNEIAPHGSFRCEDNNLTNLTHCPQVDELICNNNLLKNLADAPACNILWAVDNPFETFKDTPDHIQHVVIGYKPNLPLLGLLTVGKIEIEPIPGFHHENQIKPIEQILNKYTRQGKGGQLKCAAELVRAGFKEHAYL